MIALIAYRYTHQPYLEQFPKESDEVRPFADAIKGLQGPVDQLVELGPFLARLWIRGQR